MSLKVNGSLLLSEPKLRAVVENAKQMLKVIINQVKENGFYQAMIMHLMSHPTSNFYLIDFGLRVSFSPISKIYNHFLFKVINNQVKVMGLPSNDYAIDVPPTSIST